MRLPRPQGVPEGRPGADLRLMNILGRRLGWRWPVAIATVVVLAVIAAVLVSSGGPSTPTLAAAPADCRAPATQATAPPSPAPVNGSASPGAPGIGDSYYPLAGNGGYDVANY